ncbi:ZCCHC11 [Cordylochernes scorpioides]|uniref:ZCCHC11 n=1 Tax=Cordylochernes scorpioides TaxID=51811 RepID=A0ABY6K9B5_9ARAC|nr:ZCCHC11 [Cordylochernes scorpioides]
MVRTARTLPMTHTQSEDPRVSRLVRLTPANQGPKPAYSFTNSGQWHSDVRQTRSRLSTPLPSRVIVEEVCFPLKEEGGGGGRNGCFTEVVVADVCVLRTDAILELFGSSVNGFGFKNCDMDICMTFVDKKCEEMEQPQVQVQIIELLAQHLACNTDYERVIPITTAKVPIVKLKFSKTEMEADISLYNTLAKHNTELLKTYTHIDRRVQILGFVMKHFAKLFEIGDASSGSLSSYAYILMVIYFLQQRDPPVLPVLQELHPNPQRRPQRMVKEWDTWFFNDTSRLREMWPAGGKNKETIGQLLVQIFKFYTETFEFDKYVVSIRQRSPMTRLEKLWNSKCIVIEALTRKQLHLATEIGLGLPHPMREWIRPAAG